MSLTISITVTVAELFRILFAQVHLLQQCVQERCYGYRYTTQNNEISARCW